MVDKADVDETNATASIQNISRVFEQTWVVPETDALFFSKVAQTAQKTEGYHGSTAASTYTKASEALTVMVEHQIVFYVLNREHTSHS